MTEKRIKDTDNVRTHLEEMTLIYERLSGMGAQIHDQDYTSMILMSLPKTYTMHLETIADSTSSIGRPLSTHDFITKAIELYEKRQLRIDRDTKSGSKDTAFQSGEQNCNKKGKGRTSKKDVECHNCHYLL